MVVPSAAVTTTVSVLRPSVRLIGLLAAPDVVALPLIFTVEVGLAVTGVRVIVLAVLGTVIS